MKNGLIAIIFTLSLFAGAQDKPKVPRPAGSVIQEDESLPPALQVKFAKLGKATAQVATYDAMQKMLKAQFDDAQLHQRLSASEQAKLIADIANQLKKEEGVDVRYDYQKQQFVVAQPPPNPAAPAEKPEAKEKKK